MNSRTKLHHLLAALVAGVLLGASLMAATPAGAEVASVVSTNWKKIWKKELKPQADKRYYTKSRSDARYATEAEAAAAVAAANGATDSKLTGYYKKSEIDAKLAPLVNSVAATAGGEQELALTPDDQVVRSVSIVPPSNGMVVVSSSAYVQTLASGPFRCSLVRGSVLDFTALQMVRPAVDEYETIAGTRGFVATKGSLLTVNLVCDEHSGEAILNDSSLTAVFAPS